MSYVNVPQPMYQSGQPGTPWHQGDQGWTAAPIPSWGTNPNLVGPRQIATGSTSALLAGVGGLGLLVGAVGLAGLVLWWGHQQAKKDLAGLRRSQGFKGNGKRHRRNAGSRMKWSRNYYGKSPTPFYYSGDYMIVAQNGEYMLFYRPPGENHHLGPYHTLARAKWTASHHRAALTR